MLFSGVCCRCSVHIRVCFFFFKQRTAYEMRISDWRSDVCSSDLATHLDPLTGAVLVDLDDGASDEDHLAVARALRGAIAIGSAACRERVCQYGQISVVAVSLKKHEI